MSSANKWITDRLPTEADGDMDGGVLMALAPGPTPDEYWVIHWSCVGPGAAWQHTGGWQPPAEPAPTDSDRISALEREVAELRQLFWSHSHPGMPACLITNDNQQ